MFEHIHIIRKSMLGSLADYAFLENEFLYRHYADGTLSYLRSSYITGSHKFLMSGQEEFPEQYLDLFDLFLGVETDMESLEAELYSDDVWRTGNDSKMEP